MGDDFSKNYECFKKYKINESLSDFNFIKLLNKERWEDIFILVY